MVGGFVALCVTGRGQCVEVQKTKIYGDFFKIEFTPNSNILTGKLMINFNAYRICHGGIKVRLEGNLEVMGKQSTRKTIPVDIFENCPTETMLTCGDLLRGQKRLSFILKIPSGQSYPSPFMTSNGSLTYRLIALIQRDDTWEIFAKKLVNFKGYYNIQHMALNPYEQTQVIQTKTGQVVSIFTVPNTVVVMGRCESVEAVLELHGSFENDVKATLMFFRNIIYGGNIHTDTIWSQNIHSELNQTNALFKWTFIVPMMPKSSYSNELIPMYSVRYYLKFEAFSEKFGIEEQHNVINGIVEVEVGTTREPCGNNTNDNTNRTTDQGGQSAQTNRRQSAVSMMSLLSLPPAYSQLQTRSGSMVSLETLPPRYDEVKNN